MTRVGFYVVQSDAPGARLSVAVRLAEKAFQQGHRIFINAVDESQARQLDEMLWSHKPASFLPHALHGKEHSETIAIGWGQEPGAHNDLLFNLQLETPPFLVGGQRFSPKLAWFRGDPEKLEEENQVLLKFLEKKVFCSDFSLVLDCHSGFGFHDRIWFPYAYRKQPISNLKDINRMVCLRL